MKKHVIVVVGYLLLGMLGLALAIPPGYVSPVFPAAGFALAAALHFGVRLLPAIWMGSFLLNLGVAASHDSLSIVAAIAAAGIATGAVLQAGFGVSLVRRYLGREALHLESVKQILMFLTLGGGIPCVVSASVGTSILVGTGIVSVGSAGYAWWNWYVGDLMGVTTFAAVALGLLQRDDPYWRRRLRNMALPVLTLILLAAVTFLASAHWERLQQDSHVAAHGEVVANRLQTQINKSHEVLGVLSHFLEVPKDVSTQEFSHVTDVLLKEHPEISAFSFNLIVTEEQRERFERETGERIGRPNFRITERKDGQLVVADPRARYVVVSMIAPLLGNEAALGFDISSEPKRREAIMRAQASGALSATAPLRLVQDKTERVGILLLHPSTHEVPAEGGLPASNDIVGFAVAVLKLDVLFQTVAGRFVPEGMIAEISEPELSGSVGDSLLYRSTAAARMPNDGIAPWMTTLQLADRRLTLTMRASEAYANLHRPWVAWVIGAVAMLFVSVFQVLMLVSTGRASQIQRQVDEQTVKLSAQNEQLQASEAKLNRVIDVMPEVVIVVDAQGMINRANERVRQVLGYAPDELFGQPVEVLVPMGARGHHPKLRAHYNQNPDIRHMVVGKELFAVHKDGRTIPVEVSLAPMSDGPRPHIVVTLIDISQRLAKEQALRDSEQRFRLMAEGIHDFSILFLDQNGIIISWNKGVERMKGYQAEEVIGKPITIFYTKEDRAAGVPENLLQQARESGSVANQGWRIRKDGSRFFADVIVTAIRNESRELLGYAKITRDVSEHKRLQDELQEYRENLEVLVQHRTADLEVAKEAAEAASRAKTAFLSMASHELRTPMNGIMGTLALAKRHSSDVKMDDYLHKADRSAKHLLNIINDVLDISRIEADKLTLENIPFAIDDILGHVEDNLGDLAATKGIRMRFGEFDALRDHQFMGDPTRITQVLMNLVGNALKFTSHGSVVTTVTLKGQSDAAPVLHFSVVDTGIGIGEDDLARIFNPFEQADNGMTRKFGGTGLGLALCRRLMDAMGGRIGVTSTKGQGSTFWFEIPVPEYSVAPRTSKVDVEAEILRALRERHAGIHVLLAEDEPINQEIFSSFLEEAAITVTIAADGQKAVEAAQAQAFDLILMDMNMPVMGGVEATRRIRALPGYAAIPIIALTANAFAEDRAVCIDAGMNDHVGKPVVPEAFYAAILRWLDAQTVA